jgi:hypothetical protein
MGLLVISSASLFAQTGGSTSSGQSGGSTSSGASGTATSGTSQADQDLDAARRAAGTNSSTSGNSGAGTGAAGTDAGIGARRNDATGDAVDRSRQRNLPGARPGDAPSQRPGGSAVTEPTPSVTDVSPDQAGVGTSVGSRPGASLGGQPSSGASTTNGAITTNGGTDSGAVQRDSQTTARMIGETSFAYRDRAMQMVEGELSTGSALGSSILQGTESLSGTARTRVNDSMTRANEARTELAKAISRARSANESRWNDSRSEVAERYEAYSKALEDARAAAVEAGIQLPDASATTAPVAVPQ